MDQLPDPQRPLPPAENPAGPSSRRTPLWQAALFLLAIWTVPAIMTGTQFHLLLEQFGKTSTLWSSFLWELPDWYSWALLTPLVLFMCRRFPIERQIWKRNLLPHLLLLVLIVPAWTAMATVFVQLRGLEKEPWSFEKTFWFFLWRQGHVQVLIYAAVTAVGSALEYRRRFQERELRATQLEAALAQAQLRALKMQLHPHFLFNTLHAISALVRTGDNKGAIKTIVGLSDLLRYTLDNANAHTVPLRRELDFLQRYLEIQQIRFKDRLQVELDLPAQVLDAVVPSLILQPLVENAIQHAIAPRTEPGLIKVVGRLEGTRLRLCVEDDGPGLPEGWKLEESHGVGLSNTKARLEQLYGPLHSFEVGPRQPAGTVACLTLPAQGPAPLR